MSKFINKININNTINNNKYNCDSIKVERGASLHTASLVEGSVSNCEELTGTTTHEYEYLSSSYQSKPSVGSGVAQGFLGLTWSLPSHGALNVEFKGVNSISSLGGGSVSEKEKATLSSTFNRRKYKSNRIVKYSNNSNRMVQQTTGLATQGEVKSLSLPKLQHAVKSSIAMTTTKPKRNNSRKKEEELRKKERELRKKEEELRKKEEEVRKKEEEVINKEEEIKR